MKLGFLLGIELSGVLEPQPAAFLEVWLGEDLPFAHGIHGLINELHEVEPIEGNLGVGQVLGSPFLEGWGEIHAHIGDPFCATPMGL